MFDFWQVQSSKLLFPEIAWNKPEQKIHAGKLLIIGGGAGAFRHRAGRDVPRPARMARRRRNGARFAGLCHRRAECRRAA